MLLRLNSKCNNIEKRSVVWVKSMTISALKKERSSRPSWNAGAVCEPSPAACSAHRPPSAANSSVVVGQATAPAQRGCAHAALTAIGVGRLTGEPRCWQSSPAHSSSWWWARQATHCGRSFAQAWPQACHPNRSAAH